MKVKFYGECAMDDTVAIWKGLTQTLEETHSNAIIVNDKRYFYHIFKTMGIQDKVIQDAWVNQKVTVPGHGLIYIFRKQTMHDRVQNAILLFPSVELIRACENDEALEEYAVLYDKDEIEKILSGKVVLPDV